MLSRCKPPTALALGRGLLPVVWTSECCVRNQSSFGIFIEDVYRDPKRVAELKSMAVMNGVRDRKKRNTNLGLRGKILGKWYWALSQAERDHLKVRLEQRFAERRARGKQAVQPLPTRYTQFRNPSRPATRPIEKRLSGALKAWSVLRTKH